MGGADVNVEILPPEHPIPGADRTPEERGLARDEIRLLVSDARGERDHRFRDLAAILRPHDLLVVNESATLAARLPARGRPGEFEVRLSTRYDPRLWLVETRWSAGRPGPVELDIGEAFEVAGVPGRLVSDYPGIPRLSFLRTDDDLRSAMARLGRPIRYGYLTHDHPLTDYQTLFARVPGSAEMPSAGRPFTRRTVEELRAVGVRFASIVLHTGVSSLETDAVAPGYRPVYPEPFEVPAATVRAIHETHAERGRVIAVGTTVVRALESAVDGCGLRPARGFTRLFLRGGARLRVVDGLLTGFHAARTTHLELLSALASPERLRRAYAGAIERGYLWHEFGDSHLILPDSG
jgi:S-adenosylmethionine:tRNA ribosyltransferase-isomerase